MKKITVFIIIFTMLAALCCCSKNSNTAKGRVSEDNGIAAGVDIEVGN